MSYQCIKSTNKQIPNEDLLDLQKEIQKLDKNEEICYKEWTGITNQQAEMINST